jgi:hypothetical protein
MEALHCLASRGRSEAVTSHLHGVEYMTHLGSVRRAYHLSNPRGGRIRDAVEAVAEEKDRD